MLVFKTNYTKRIGTQHTSEFVYKIKRLGFGGNMEFIGTFGRSIENKKILT